MSVSVDHAEKFVGCFFFTTGELIRIFISIILCISYVMLPTVVCIV